MRSVEPIRTEPNSYRDGTVSTHPAFGQITLHRLEGGHQALYGSDFAHRRAICIQIHESTLNRDLSRDWAHAGKVIAEVRMSEAQWATFVSSMNVGMGVQCTIAYREGKGEVPAFELPTDHVQQFSDEMQDKLSETVAGFRKTLEQIDSMGLPKAKAAALKAPFERAITEMRSNMPFVAKSFSEHMERTVEKAKVEIHGYLNATVQAAGLAAITEGQGPLVIEMNETGV